MDQAAYYDVLSDGSVVCLLCPQSCLVGGGRRGQCGVRQNQDGVLVPLTYGKITSAALDPLEKKPLYHYFPGRPVYSIGSWGCNLHCMFCQNSAISQRPAPTRDLPPEDLARIAMRDGSVGVAYTYNEPAIAFEYVMDCARAVRGAGGKNILVTNGFLNPEPWEELLGVIDAANIDIKAFNNDFYRRLCGGALEPVLRNAEKAAGKIHLEVTTLIIPGENDGAPELEMLAKWIAERCGKKTPAHLSAYFPRYQMNVEATRLEQLRHAREIFLEHLDYVYLGNVSSDEGSDTVCARCGSTVVKRRVFDADTEGMNPDGSCARCRAANGIVNQ